MLSYRFDLDTWNAPREVHSATYACESPVWHYNTGTANWEFDASSRTIVYAQGLLNQPLVQKDQGYEFVEGNQIHSYFRRDNITLLKDYSGKLMVHRILPEIYNIGDNELVVKASTNPELIGTVSFAVEGSESVGQEPVEVTTQDLATNTSYPWIQVDQNAHRVNSLVIENTSKTNMWMCTATTWQYTEVEDDR
jgi:hypothetical protein